MAHGDCLAVLRAAPDNTFDAVVTDPPYGLSNTDPEHTVQALTQWLAGERAYTPPVSGGGFMGKTWDAFVPPPALWDEVFRTLKPGGFLLCFAGTRTQDLMGLSIRLAGFEIRDSITWLYGSGFPKSMDVSKAIDKAAGAERTERLGLKPGHDDSNRKHQMGDSVIGDAEGGFSRPWMDDPEKARDYHYQFAPATPEAEQWQGWGTAGWSN